MSVRRNPLSLQTLGKMSLVESSIGDLERWLKIADILPSHYKNEVRILMKAGSLVQNPSVKKSHLLYDLLETCLQQFDTIRAFELGYLELKSKDPSKVVNIMYDMHTKKEVNFNEIVLDVHNIFDLEESLCQFLLLHITDVVILNNLLALASLYGEISFIDRLVFQGADDFHTAQKLAALGNCIEMVLYLDIQEPSHKCVTICQKDVAYSHYYEVVLDEDMDEEADELTQFLNYVHMEDLITKMTPRTSFSSYINTLNIPICLWGKENVLAASCHSPWSVTLGLVRAIHPSRPAFTPTPPGSPPHFNIFEYQGEL